MKLDIDDARCHEPLQDPAGRARMDMQLRQYFGCQFAWVRLLQPGGEPNQQSHRFSALTAPGCDFEPTHWDRPFDEVFTVGWWW